MILISMLIMETILLATGVGLVASLALDFVTIKLENMLMDFAKSSSLCKG